MILDHLDSACPNEKRADLCIIGAGAAGLALAVELANSGLQVVILESGGWEHEERTQDLYSTIQSGMPFHSALGGRFRIFGGSTTRWGGQSLPLTDLDFETREWVQHSGWPISREQLGSYYDRANRFLGVDTIDYHDDTAKLLKTKRLEFEDKTLDYHYSKWAPQPDLRKVYRSLLERSENIDVVLHANLRELELEEEQVRLAHYVAFGGKSRRCACHRIHHCCGRYRGAPLALGLESPETGWLGQPK